MARQASQGKASEMIRKRKLKWAGNNIGMPMTTAASNDDDGSHDEEYQVALFTLVVKRNLNLMTLILCI